MRLKKRKHECVWWPSGEWTRGDPEGRAISWEATASAGSKEMAVRMERRRKLQMWRSEWEALPFIKMGRLEGLVWVGIPSCICWTAAPIGPLSRHFRPISGHLSVELRREIWAGKTVGSYQYARDGWRHENALAHTRRVHHEKRVDILSLMKQ